jgi:hypothetical protein
VFASFGAAVLDQALGDQSPQVADDCGLVLEAQMVGDFAGGGESILCRVEFPHELQDLGLSVGDVHCLISL